MAISGVKPSVVPSQVGNVSPSGAIPSAAPTATSAPAAEPQGWLAKATGAARAAVSVATEVVKHDLLHLDSVKNALNLDAEFAGKMAAAGKLTDPTARSAAINQAVFERSTLQTKVRETAKGLQELAKLPEPARSQQQSELVKNAFPDRPAVQAALLEEVARANVLNSL